MVGRPPAAGHPQGFARPGCSWVKEAAAASVPQAWEAAIIPVCPSQPIFSLAGPARKTQQHEGLDWGLVRPPAACPSMSGGLPCQGSLALPAGALASLSQASPSPVAWKTVKLNPEGSSHQRAGQTWLPPPPQASPQGRLELGELCLGCLCCQLRARREKKWSVLWEGMAPTILSTQWFKSVLHGSASCHGEGICPVTGEAGGHCRAAAACGSHGSSAFKPCVPKVCCTPTVCLGKTNEKHNLKVIWNVYVGPMRWIKAGPWKGGKECAVQ